MLDQQAVPQAAPQALALFRFSGLTQAQRRTLLAAALGWMFDGMDVMLYALVLTQVMSELHMTKAAGGLVGTMTLLGSGLGGVLFGWLADRAGRKRALALSILTYSVCSLASGLAVNVYMLGATRFLLGLGMGGEWNAGATLVAETWPTQLRARAMALVQSSFALGCAAAALVAGMVLPHGSWRVVFAVGVLPALLALWIHRAVPESEVWRSHRADRAASGPAPTGWLMDLFRHHLRTTLALLAMNFFGMFAWWGLFTWVPAYLKLPLDAGGRGFDADLTTSLLVVLNLVGMFPGYASFGWVADHLGRRRSVLLFTLCAALSVPFYAMATSPWLLLVLGIPVAYFGSGFFSGSSIIGSEVFPTRVRAQALGFTYNGARALGSIAPFVIGWVGQSRGLSWAFLLCAGSFFCSMLAATWLPETRGRVLV